MNNIADIGALVQVTPWDDLQVTHTIVGGEFVHDETPFVFRVEGRLEDGQLFYGLYGPVVSGPERYHNLICNIMIREDATDWRITSEGSANFKVGPTKVTRCHMYDFRHPEGTAMEGLPRISRFGEVRVVG